MLEGDESSSNVVTIIELNGLIVETSSEVSKFNKPIYHFTKRCKKKL